MTTSAATMLLQASPNAADHPAEPAPERVAEHADVRRRAGEVGEAVLAGRDGERLRQHARLDPRAPRRRVDLDPAHPLRLQEQRVPAPVDRAGVVAAGIERDAQAALGGEADGRHDIVRRLRVDDGDGPLVDGQVPRLSCAVPRLVARQHDDSAETIAEITVLHVSPRWLFRLGVGRTCLLATERRIAHAEA